MTEQPTESARGTRAYKNFFSSVGSFSLPAGSHVTAGAVRGYYIDFSVKASAPTWPEPGAPPTSRLLHVVPIQWALGCYERYLAGDGETWLAGALALGEELLASQQRDGRLAGAWLHDRGFPHTYSLRPPWVSGMAQGEGASLLVRLFGETREQRFADGARLALQPLAVPTAEGGTGVLLGDGPFVEEYPTTPSSFVLNGGIFAMWGLHDVGTALDEAQTLADFERHVDALAANIERWDLGYWSRYDLFPHPAVNIASSFYHDLHIKQLRMTNELAPRDELAGMADRWTANTSSALSRRRAFAAKVMFRLLVPRNRVLATRLPWSPVENVGEAVYVT